MYNFSANRLTTSVSAERRPRLVPLWARARGRGRRERRGVLLLLMLCLLLLFAVLGVAYVLVASQFRRSMVVQPRLEQYAPDYRKQLDEAAMQVFRGSSSSQSVLSIHSLLEDLYGNDAVASSSSSFTTASTATLPSGTAATPITISKATISLSSSNSPAPNASQLQLIDLTLGLPSTPTPLPWPLSFNSAANTAAKAAGATSGTFTSPYLNITDDTNGAAPSGFFNGCVLTFLTGPAAGQSTRIVGYDNGLTNIASGGSTLTNSTGTTTLRVMDFPGASAMVNATTTTNSWQFLINGRPFNGVGFGFSFVSNLVDASDGTHLFALLPNPVTFNNSATGALAAYNVAGGIGGADEDYDAADWNNMLLGLPLDPRDVTGNLGTVAAPNPIKFPPYPSLHRPELLSYWVNQIKPTNGIQDPSFLPLLRQVMLRPIGPLFDPTHAAYTSATPDHPNFTGSNLNPNGGFDPINGPWDVDNDGDGVPDSIWVDLGSPVQTAIDGTTYKPLYAIRVLDMDGRLNVNAHGNSGQLETAYTAPTPVTADFAGTGGAPQNPLTPGTVAATAATAATHPAPGSGYGTAEINLLPLYAQQTTTLSTLPLQRHQYGLLFAGNTASGTAPTFEGRYGESTTGMSTPSAEYDSTLKPSASTPPYAGLTLSNDIELTASALGLIKHWDFPFPGYATMLTAYGSAPDLWGRSFTALDIGGAPLMPSLSATPFQSTATSTTWPGGLGGQYDTINNPYLLNLSRSTVRGAKITGATDNPFAPAELERLLRAYDADAGALSPRLATLLDTTSAVPPPTGKAPLGNSIQILRRQVTTDSFDLPSPSLLVCNTTTAQTKPAASPTLYPAPLAASVADILLARISAIETGTTTNPGPNRNFATNHKLSDPMVVSGGTHSGWNNIPIQLQLMLPPELLNGQRFDINRPFGNGRDDDQDGVVDEPDEYSLGEPAWITPSGTRAPMNSGTSPFPGNTASGSTTNAINLAIDWNGDGTINLNDALMARHVMARHLYVLAMMLIDPSLLTATNQPNAIQYDADGPAGFYAGPTQNNYQVQYALAQWAINAVDFRDRDSTMTPFEFDINPFDGWGVDGVLGTADDASAERGLIWGCERPELLITETLAWHDRRTQDLSADNGKVGATPPDQHGDFDQQLLPMPACFIELYNPWTTQYSDLNANANGTEQVNAPSAAEVPGEFYYDPNSANVAYMPYGSGNSNYPTAQPPTGVILSKAVAGATGTSPVWRLIFVNNGPGGSQLPAPYTGDELDPRMVDPDDPIPSHVTSGTLGFANLASYIDRIVYFVAPTGGYTAGFPSPNCVVYYPGPTQPIPAALKPGHYAVVGSAGGANNPAGGDTYAGVGISKLGRSPGNTNSPPAADTNPRRIVLSPSASSRRNQVTVFNSGQATTEPVPILGGGAGLPGAQDAIAIALDTAITSAGPSPPRPFGISDPIVGYQAGTVTANAAGEPQYAAVHRQPADLISGDPQMMINQTIPWYRTVHLQRLANPQLAWNATTNPYLTIDSASVDVTAFNGVSTTQDPTPPGITATGLPTASFCSTQRGDQYALGAGNMPPSIAGQPNLLWVHEFGHIPGAGVFVQPAVNVSTSLFTPALNHSIGYLNQMYGIASTRNTAYTAAANSAYTSANYPTPSPYIGMPKTPFPWLTWNNRPYTTPLELALVPKSRSSRLLFDYSAANGATPPIYSSQSGAIVLYPDFPYPAGSGGFVANPQPGATFPFFGHLLNFFDEASPIPANLYRLFEYVQVPSRYVGTETMLSPFGTKYGIMNSNSTSTTPTLLTGDAVPGSPPPWSGANPTYTLGSSPMGTYLRPPLNKVSEYRDPGRVNVNTVQDPAVWQGVLNGSYYPQLAPAATGSTTIPNIAGTMITNLGGALGTAPTASTGSPATATAVGNGYPPPPPAGMVPTNTPSYFTNPFRSFSGAALTNSIYASQNYAVGAIKPYPNGIGLFPTATALRDIDATLLRPSLIGSTAGIALFDSQALGGSAPALQPYNDSTRSPFFRLQNASRVSNLLTTRSNVYAVWITVGYFQVTTWYGTTPTTPPKVICDMAHPDGYQLGQELGSDSGQIKRHRAFYLFDRTIPVGFERGVDHNVQNAILLRRFIE